MTDLLDQAEVTAAEALLAPAQEVAVRAHSEPDAVRLAIVGMAENPALDVEKLKALIEMQDRMEDRQAERAFTKAFVAMQGMIPTVKRNGTLEYPVDKNKPDGPKRLVSKYAKWEDIEAAIQPILAEHHFGLSFKITPRLVDGGGLLVAAVLRHGDGHTEIGDPIPVPLDTSGGKNNIQAYGSALSYGQRYAAKAAGLIRIEGDDDDGKRGGMVFVTEEQVLQLQALALETKTEEGLFVELMTSEARSWEEIDAKDFPRLANALQRKKHQMARKKPATEASEP
jgi:ERF superfamily protein